MVFVFGIILLAIVAAIVIAPLRGSGERTGENPVAAELEARKEAKYREIRDTRLDHEVGKLSEADFRVQDAALRGEALEILDELESHASTSGRASEAPGGGSAGGSV